MKNFNHLINQAWLNGSFDEMQNFPKDFFLEYFEKFLNEKIDKTAFRKVAKFLKNQLKNLQQKVNKTIKNKSSFPSSLIRNGRSS